MNPAERATIRLIRGTLAGIAVLTLKTIAENLTKTNIPVIVIPIAQAVLNAIAKYIRDKYKKDIIL